jgi:hypothetical protein
MSYSGQGARESRRGAGRASLPRPLRMAVYVVGTLLWLSGAVWMLLHYAFPQRSDFGALPNPAEAPLMRIHGLIAVGGVFLIGWLSAVHVSTQWSKERNRRSGLTLGASALLLILSGYALYYTTGSPHDTAGIFHELLGILSPAAALLHWWRNRAST